jgi:hypothetical protein
MSRARGLHLLQYFALLTTSRYVLTLGQHTVHETTALRSAQPRLNTS